MVSLAKFKRFDVRPLLSRGVDPLADILQRVKILAPDEGIIIVAPFLPSPLVELLGSQGFNSRVEPGERGTWFVYFWREKE
ncbi:MAG: DUF2249 domain-containing protein [Limisphaerales bacterium]